MVNIKIWLQRLITGEKSRPKQPRKKLQIQFEEIKQQFDTQVELLEQTLKRPDLMTSATKLGKLLLQDVHRFQELHLARINQARLNSIVEPLIHPVDFSLWVIYQMHAYTEEIYHYIKTVERVEL